MSVDFSKVKSMTIPEGVVTQIADASGRVLWAVSGGKVVLEVKKITSATYAGETTYTDEQFILLDIYPKTNGTVNVTYGGLTKTITDTSGAAEPNAQQVFFGTFNGVSDDVATPASGKLTIDGECNGFACGSYNKKGSKAAETHYCGCITAVGKLSDISSIPINAFRGCAQLTGSVIIPEGVTIIGDYAFAGCLNIDKMVIPASVTSIGTRVFGANTMAGSLVTSAVTLNGDFLTIDENNATYYFSNSCIIMRSNNEIIRGFSDAVIPNGIKSIGDRAFVYVGGMPESLVIPEGVEKIGEFAFNDARGVVDLVLPSTLTFMGEAACSFLLDLERVVVKATTPPTVGGTSMKLLGAEGGFSVTVPKGCSAAYKAAKGWDVYADYIVEES